MNFVLLVLFAVFGAANFTRSMAFDPYQESAETSEFDSLREGYVATDCIDPPPSAPDCRSYKKTPPGAVGEACLRRDQLEEILKTVKDLTLKVEDTLKTSKSKGTSGAPTKDVKSAVGEGRWSVEGGDLRNVHSGGRSSRFRNRSPWRSEAD
jgi:hypothetical protein